MASRRNLLLLLSLICLLSLIPWLGATRLWDDDEGFFAATAAEMFSRGDWIVPYFNGELFGHKPPWMYWMMMLGIQSFGVNEFAVRIVSTLFGAGTALLTYHIGQRLFSQRAGFMAGTVVITSLMFNVVSRAATPDIYLVFFSSCALWVFARSGFLGASNNSENAETAITGQKEALPDRWRHYLLMYALMGIGVLVKGPIGVLFPMAVIGMFLLCMTERKTLPEGTPQWRQWLEKLRPFGPVNFVRTVWRMRPLTAIAVVLLVAGPWYLAVGVLTDGEFLREFFGVHHFQRFSAPMENHNGTIFYYIATILVGMFPWSIFNIPIILCTTAAIRRGERVPEFTFLLCWAGVYVGLFSLAATKLPNYVLPAYPPLALLCGFTLDQWLTDSRRVHMGWVRTGLALLLVIGAGLSLGWPLVLNLEWNGQTLLDRAEVSRTVQAQAGMLGLIGVPMLLGGIFALLWSGRPNGRMSLAAVSVTAVVTVMVLWGFTAPQVDRLQSAQSIAIDIRERTGQQHMRVAQFGCFRPSMVFYAEQQIEKCSDANAALKFFESPESGLLVTTDTGLERLQDQLPADVVVLEKRPKFPKSGELVLLGRETATVNTLNRIAAHSRRHSESEKEELLR